MLKTPSQRSIVWMPPPAYRNDEACGERDRLKAHLHPVSNRIGISMRHPARRVKNQPGQDVGIGSVGDFSLGKAIPQPTPAIDAQIERDDASGDFIQEKLHTRLVGARASQVQATRDQPRFALSRSQFRQWCCPQLSGLRSANRPLPRDGALLERLTGNTLPPRSFFCY